MALIDTAVETEEFLNPSRFALALRLALKLPILRAYPPALRAEFAAGWDASSRPIEILVENLGWMLLRHPRKTVQILDVLADWRKCYYGAQADEVHRYLIYTQHDLSVPFIPEDDIAYSYMLAQIATVGRGLVRTVPMADIRRLCAGVKAMNRAAIDSYHRFPTVMPRINDHRRLNLRILQGIDKPYNCCPSLHIAYSLFMFNLAEHYGLDSLDDLRWSAIRMFNSVLFTRQHALWCVAGGMACARLVYEEIYGPMYDFTDRFEALAERFPVINYAEIRRLYEWVMATPGSLADRLEICLRAEGFAEAATPPGADLTACYFDTEQRRILPLPPD